MIKKKNISIITLLIICLFTVGNASGLFPSMDEMLGTAMPSVDLVIGREADKQVETDAGKQNIYLNFSGEDYNAFGQYLGGIGAIIKEYNSENNVITTTISARDAEMIFIYDWENNSATAVYPNGTRVEKELEAVEKGDSILPLAGRFMPSAEIAIGRKPDKQVDDEEGLVQTWTIFTDDDYIAFSNYLADTRAELGDSSIEAGIINAEVELNGFSFRFIYNWNKQSADVVYPQGTTPETGRRKVPTGNGSILPEIKEIGRELPRISMALERKSSSSETLNDGSSRETYLGFSEADYNIFSQYLKKTGCTLEDYYSDDNGILVINLTNGSGKMVFSYDALHHVGIAEYPKDTRIEKNWTPTPTLEPTSKHATEPTTKPSDEEYHFTTEEFSILIQKGIDGTLTSSEAELLVLYYQYYK